MNWADLIDLTDRETVKRYVGPIPSGTEWDDLIDWLITATSQHIQELHCGRRFDSQTYTNELHDGDDTPVLYPDHPPILSLTAASIGGVALSVASDVYIYADRIELPWNEDTYLSPRYGTGVLRAVWPRGQQNVSITYSGGYTDVPAAVALACVETVAYILGKRGREATPSVGTPTAGNTNYLDIELPVSAQAKLAPYVVRHHGIL